MIFREVQLQSGEPLLNNGEKEIRMEDFQEQAIPHLENIYRAALRLTKNHSAAGDLTEPVNRQELTAFCFYKPEIDCRVWLRKILFLQFLRCRQKTIDYEFVESRTQDIEISRFA